MDYNKKKKINIKLKKITDINIFQKIFNIISNDLYHDNGDKKFSENNNGIFFNINCLSESTLVEIEEFLDNMLDISDTSETSNIKYSNYSNEETKNKPVKLSNKEMSLINSINSIKD